MEISALALIGIALLLAGWTLAAAVMMLRASDTVRRTRSLKTTQARLQHLLDVAPAVPLLVRVDGRIEAPDKLARLLGLQQMPKYLSELAGQGDPAMGALSADQVALLSAKVQATQKSAAPFRITLTPPRSKRSLALHGTLADPQVSPSGAALVWVFDFTQSHEEMARLRAATRGPKGDFGALVGLIEAAPVPMWFRGSDMRLQLVNQAYVDAVGAASAVEAVAGQIELLEAEDGRSPADIARRALEAQGKQNAMSPPPSMAHAGPCGSAICQSARKVLRAMPSTSRNSSR
jgi:PAS domain-containing protein